MAKAKIPFDNIRMIEVHQDVETTAMHGAKIITKKNVMAKNIQMKDTKKKFFWESQSSRQNI